MLRIVIALMFAGGGLAGCAGDAASNEPGDDGPPEPVGTVEIGLPGGDDELEFTPLEAGGEIRLQTFGQGGTHLLIGVRCTGFGSRAYVSITVENSLTGVKVRTPAPVRPQLLYCHEDGSACDLVPLLAMTSGLTDVDEERDGLPIRISATVKNEAGTEAYAAQTAVLSTADL